MYPIAIFIMILAIIFQRLGTTGTCTQGADGPFMTGVVLSTPLLLLVLTLMFLSWWRTKEKPSFSYIETVYLAILIGLSFYLVFLNTSIWYQTLIAGGSPCGPDYSWYVSGSESSRIRALIIGLIYGLVPFIISVISRGRLVKISKHIK